MAVSEHIEWLLEGVEAWNKRRCTSRFRPDFSNLAFRRIFFGNPRGLVPEWAQQVIPSEDATIDTILDSFSLQVDLVNNLNATSRKTGRSAKPGTEADNGAEAGLYGHVDAALREKVFLRVPLAGADFKLADLTGSHLSGADLRGADLRLADLRGARLRLADLSEANMEGCNLSGAVLWDVDFRNANLTGALLDGAELWRADLRGANLKEVDLSGADLWGAEPWRAELYAESDQSPAQHDLEHSAASTVGSVEDLLQIIRSVNKLYSDDVVLYFRGEGRSTWPLKPSVMRQGYSTFESDMLLDLASRRPEEFSDKPTALEQWVLAQHHTLKTRFLDVSRNPLVALFFACCERECLGEDGQLHVFIVPKTLIKRFNSDTVSIIANFAKLTRDEQDLVVGKVTQPFSDSAVQTAETIAKRNRRLTHRGGSPVNLAMAKLYQLIRDEKPYFRENIDIRDLLRVFVIEPQHSPERIRAQAGAFLVSAFHDRFEREQILKWNEKLPVYAHNRVAVSAMKKDHMMEDLRLLGITRESLFPGLDETAKAISSSYHGPASEAVDEN